MASMNQVTLIGRLTRDPESRSFANGGMVCKFGFAVDGKKSKDQATGQWKSEPVFIDIEAFNRGEKGKLASICEEYLKKGSMIAIQGKLVLQQWTSGQGEKRSKLMVEADEVQFLDTGKKDAGASHQEQESTYSAPNPDAEVGNLFS